MKIAPKQWISWKTCDGIEEFWNKQGIRQNQYAFIYRRWTKCSDLNLIEFTLTINSNFTVAFSGEQNLNRRLHRPFLKKGNSPAFNSAPPKFIFLNLSSFLFLLEKFYGGNWNEFWLIGCVHRGSPYLFSNKIPLHERSLLFFTSHNQPSSLALSEGATPDRLLFQATHPEEHVQTELWSLFSFVLNHPKNKFNNEF